MNTPTSLTELIEAIERRHEVMLPDGLSACVEPELTGGQRVVYQTLYSMGRRESLFIAVTPYEDDRAAIAAFWQAYLALYPETGTRLSWRMRPVIQQIPGGWTVRARLAVWKPE